MFKKTALLRSRSDGFQINIIVLKPVIANEERVKQTYETNILDSKA